MVKRQFKNSTILVTGAAGFIGSHLIDELLVRDAVVIGLDDLSNGNLSNLELANKNSNFTFVEGSVTDLDLLENLFKNHKFDKIFHLAALNLVRSVENPLADLETNIKGTLIILELIKKYNEEIVIVYSSSGSVYGEPIKVPQYENHPLNPNSPYGISKLAAENYVTLYNKLFGLKTISLRYYNVYGPRQNAGHGGGVISIFISNSLNRIPLKIEGDGKQERCFTYVKDVVRANILASTNSNAYGMNFNIASKNNTTIKELANILLEINHEVKITSAPERIGDIKKFNPSIAKAEDELGYVPNVKFKEGLLETYNFFYNKK